MAIAAVPFQKKSCPPCLMAVSAAAVATAGNSPSFFHPSSQFAVASAALNAGSPRIQIGGGVAAWGVPHVGGRETV